MENMYIQPYTKRAEEKVFNFRPFFFTAVFFAFGITLAYLCKYQDVSPWWCFIVLPVLAFGAFLFWGVASLKRSMLAIFTLALAFTLGYGGLQTQINAYQNGGCYEGDCIALGRVVESVEQDGRVWITVDRVRVDGNKTKGKLYAYLQAETGKEITLGDKVLLHGEIHDNTKEFNAMGIDENYRHTMYVQSYTVVGHTFDLFLSIRNRIKQALYTGMEENAAAVAMAIMAGDTSGIGEETLENMRRGGIAHVFAVSGLHIGALFGLCLWLLKNTRLKSFSGISRFAFVACILVFYGGICGFTASVTRSVLTCLLLYGATLVGVGSDALERISVSALAVMALSPVSLFCVGFQLTFSACIGIVLLKRPIYESINGLVRFICKRHIRKDEAHPPSLGAQAFTKCANFFAVTLSAQIATAPILLNAFGYLSLWGLLLNCIFVPLIAGTFSLVFSLCAVACVLPLFCARFVLAFPSALFTLLLFVFETLDFSSFCIEGLTIGKWAIAFYYLGASFVTDKWNMTKKQKAFGALLCGLTCILAVFLMNSGGIP